MNLLSAMQSTSNPIYKMQLTATITPLSRPGWLSAARVWRKAGFMIVRDNLSPYQRWQIASLKFA
jgi:hypothetical protein